MINTGLLGMAIGHGIVKEMKLDDDPPVDEDPRILNGFKALAGHIGEPKDKIKDIDYPNLYFLWGLERVCMLYNVHTVGNRDWYHWGAEALVANQDPENGSWFKKDNYPGAAPVIDTSFALMFLKKANLAKDLSAYLAFSPKKLNDGVVKLMPQPVKKPEPKPEPPKVAETKPEAPATKPAPAPVQVAEAKAPQQPVITSPIMPAPQPAAPPVVSAPPPPSGGTAWWIWLLIGVGAVMVIGGVVFIVIMGKSGGGADDDEEEDEDDRPRKKKPFKKARRR